MINISIEALALVYRASGRPVVVRMLTLPGGPLVAQAKRNRDEPAEILAKRDRAAEAIADLVEEYANLDDD